MCTRSRCSAPGSSYAVASIRRRLPAASAIQRARKPASPAASADSSCSTRRRCSPSAAASASRLSRKMSTQMRGFAPGDARHVAQRAAGRLQADRGRRSRDAPAWLRSTFASACGRWLVTRDEPVVRAGSIATGRAPSAVDEAVDEPEPLRRRRARGGVRNQVAPSNSSARGALGPSRLGAADRVAADEARIAAGRGAHRALRRADVGDRAVSARRRRAPPAPASGSAATGAATSTSSAAVDRVRERAAPARPPRVRPRPRSASGIGIPAASRATPARRPRDRRTRRSDPSRRRRAMPERRRPSASHQLGDPEREIERLPRVQTRIAERLVAVVELLLEHRLGAAEALGHVLARELEVHPSGPRADLAVRGEEALDLAP